MVCVSHTFSHFLPLFQPLKEFVAKKGYLTLLIKRVSQFIAALFCLPDISKHSFNGIKQLFLSPTQLKR
jgi:hypothetical protein